MCVSQMAHKGDAYHTWAMLIIAALCLIPGGEIGGMGNWSRSARLPYYQLLDTVDAVYQSVIVLRIFRNHDGYSFNQV